MVDSWAIALTAFIFIVWLIQAFDLCVGVLFKIPTLSARDRTDPPFGGKENLPAASLPLPKVSIIFAARNESERVVEAVRTMLAQDYPDFEVVAVNDRSTDNTLSLLKSLGPNARLKILNIESLPVRQTEGGPSGWLGKTHALYRGYQIATGEWLLFTDADVLFHPKTLRSAVGAALEKRLGHLVLFPKLVFKKWIEAVFAYAFMLAFYRHYRPWQAADPASECFIGIGAFNLVKRSAYERAGTHERLALEILDDMKLGQFLKQKGFRQMAMFGEGLIQVRWVEGYLGVVRALEKNAFAGVGYNLFLLALAAVASFVLDVLPFFMIWFLNGVAFYILLSTLVLIFFVYVSLEVHHRQVLPVFPFHPIGHLLLFGLMGYSAIKTLVQGGVTWRDTFYPLKEFSKASKK